MRLTLIDENGVRVVEGQPDESFMTGVSDVDRVIEACFSGGAKAALLYTATYHLPFSTSVLGKLA